MLTGRAKDTIVLSSGENVEPGPIEDACTASSYIQHMVLLGQDQRMLGALVVPNKEAFDELESVRGMVLLTTTPFIQNHALAGQSQNTLGSLQFYKFDQRGI